MHIIQVHFAIMFLILAVFFFTYVTAVSGCFLQNLFPPLDLLHYHGQDGKGWDRIGLFIVSVGLALHPRWR